MNKGIILTFPYPKILTHPNIPKPLHNLNPRTINGQEWWNEIRKKVYAKYDYHCLACGRHKSKTEKGWLEAHENWEINYQTGKCVVNSIQPLCHECHSFIHSGFLHVRKDKTVIQKKSILQHGFDTLRKTGFPVFPYTFNISKEYDVETYNLQPYELKINPNLKWRDFYLLYNNQKYYSLFKDYRHWIETMENR